MESPHKEHSFEVLLDRFDPYTGDIALNGLSRYTKFVDAVDSELSREELRHEKQISEIGEVVFRVYAKEIQFFSVEQAWPAIASELGLIAIKQNLDPTITIRDPGKRIRHTATDIPVIH